MPGLSGAPENPVRVNRSLTWWRDTGVALALTFSLFLAQLPVATGVHAQEDDGKHYDSPAMQYDSPEAAYEVGRRAFLRGDESAAVEPLRHAASNGVFLAKYYLAETLSNTGNVLADQREAFTLYSDIIAHNSDVDLDFDYRREFVARAYVMTGRYLSGVLPVTGVVRSEKRARRLFGFAATYLDDPDAQFEFARMQFKGRGGARNTRSAKHYFATLSRSGHGAAQGYLAELFWLGDQVPRRPDYALALSTLAVQNTPADDRIWIKELHHEIDCATSKQTHKDAERLLLLWAKTHQTRRTYPGRRGGGLNGGDVRWTCADGPDVKQQKGQLDQEDAIASADSPGTPGVGAERERLTIMHGSFLGLTGSTDDAKALGR